MWCNEGNHFPAVIETTTGHRGRQFDHPDARRLGLLCAGHRQPESADVRQHRPRLLAGAVDRRLPGRERRRHAVSAGRNADPESVSAEIRQRRRARPADAGARRDEPGIPRALRHQLGYRGRVAGLRSGGADAASRARGGRFLEGAGARARTSTESARRRPTISASSCCWRGAWWRTTSASSRSATPAAATAAGTRTAT